MKLNGLDLNKLNIFCSVVRHGGYKGASEDLNLTRSAISQAMGALEGSLGKALFLRVGNKMTPTPEAMRFFRDAQQYQNQIQNSVATLLGQDRQLVGLIRVGAYLEFTKTQLMPAIEDFLLQHPKVQIKFTFDSPSRLEAMLEKHQIDLSISIFPHRGIKAIQSRKLYQEELVLMGHRDLVPSSPDKEALKRLYIIDYFPNHILLKRWWATHYGGSFPKFSFRSYCATADMVFEMVKRKLGIGVVPKYILESHGSDDLIVIKPTDRKLMDFLWLNEIRNIQTSHAQKAFIKSVDRRLGF